MSDLNEIFERAKIAEDEKKKELEKSPSSDCLICFKKRDVCECKPNWAERDSSGV